MADRRHPAPANGWWAGGVRRIAAAAVVGCLVGMLSGEGAVDVIRDGYRSGRIGFPLTAAGGPELAIGTDECGTCENAVREFQAGFDFAAARHLTNFSQCRAGNLSRRSGCEAYVQRAFLDAAGAVDIEALMLEPDP